MRCLIFLIFLAIISVNNAEERIIGGKITTEVLPYQVSLRKTNAKRHFCGGSIIDKHFILTAGHCIYNLTHDSENPINAVVGTKYLHNGGTTYEISKLILHSKYNDTICQNDIALVKTKLPIEFTDEVAPIRLYMDEVPIRSEMLVSGWGFTDPAIPEPSEQLKTLQVYNKNLTECACIYQKYGVHMYIQPSDICAVRSIFNGVCHNDSGGPLVYEKQLVGVVSRGVPPCASGAPDLYTRPAAYIDWINYAIRNN